LTIEKYLLPLQPNFIIAINDLASGRLSRECSVGGEFFGSFENSEITGADLKVKVRAVKTSDGVRVDLDLDGFVTVACDRCLADLSLEIEVSDGEVLPFPEDGSDLDLSQTVYDYVCTSLPLVRVHPEGQCDPDTVKYLGPDPGADEMPGGIDSPFAALGNLLKND